MVGMADANFKIYQLTYTTPLCVITNNKIVSSSSVTIKHMITGMKLSENSHTEVI